MASEWPLVPFAELAVSFDTLRIPVKESHRRPGKYPYYGASGIVDHVDSFIFDGDYLLIAEDGENLKSRKLPIAFMARGRFWVNNHAHIVKGSKKADTEFLCYALQIADLNSILSGSTMPKLTQGNLSRVSVFAPPVEVQRRIADFLGSLDKRIDNLERINESLENICRSIFKSWFVDFDPVRAKAEGQEPEGMDAATAALFPSHFDETAIGLLPFGWDMVSLGDLAEFAYGKALKAEVRRNGQIPVMGSNGQIGWNDAALVNGPGIVVGRKGNPGIVTWVHTDFFPIDTTFYVKVKDLSRGLHLLRYQLAALDLPSLGADSAVPGLNREMAYWTKLANPPEGVSRQFELLITPLMEKVYQNALQIQTLVELRDTLLPRLISGKLRLPEAEKTIGAVL